MCSCSWFSGFESYICLRRASIAFIAIPESRSVLFQFWITWSLDSFQLHFILYSVLEVC
jgi:hypothetical protein